jgi:hypothetical protein
MKNAPDLLIVLQRSRPFQKLTLNTEVTYLSLLMNIFPECNRSNILFAKNAIGHATFLNRSGGQTATDNNRTSGGDWKILLRVRSNAAILRCGYCTVIRNSNPSDVLHLN